MNSGSEIRALRAKNRLSQMALAKLAAMSRYRLSLIECAYAAPTIEEAQKIRRSIANLKKTGGRK